ncbi:MAG: hypothetical protein IJF75_05045 [Clostridia bacterium]|nr:hypothetical protein [Clostridia bacterium]
MEKNSKKINGGIAFLIVLVLIFGVIISIVLVNANKTEKIELPDYTSSIEEHVLLSSGKLYTAEKTTFKKGLSYSATLLADDSQYIRNYSVSSTELKIGDIVTKDQVIGFMGETTNQVLATYSGKVVAVENNQATNEITVAVMNNECYYAEFYIAEKDRSKFQFSTELIVESNGNEFENNITNIDYKLTNNGIKITVSIQDKDFILLKGSKLTITKIEKSVENAVCISTSAIKNSNQIGTTSSDSNANVSRVEKVLVAQKAGNEYVLSYRFVTIADKNDDYYLIVDGLTDGESIFIPDSK